MPDVTHIVSTPLLFYRCLTRCCSIFWEMPPHFLSGTTLYCIWSRFIRSLSWEDWERSREYNILAYHAHTFPHSFTLVCFWEVGAKQNPQKQNPQNSRGYRNCTLLRNLSSGSNPRPWSCEEAMLGHVYKYISTNII